MRQVNSKSPGSTPIESVSLPVPALTLGQSNKGDWACRTQWLAIEIGVVVGPHIRGESAIEFRVSLDRQRVVPAPIEIDAAPVTSTRFRLMMSSHLPVLIVSFPRTGTIPPATPIAT